MTLLKNTFNLSIITNLLLFLIIKLKIKVMNKLIILLVITLIIFGCSSEEIPPKMYTLTISSNPTEGGTINPTRGEYEEGTEVTINVSPNTNYSFSSWSGSWSGSESSLTITMDSDKDLVGNFTLMDSDGDGITDDIDTCLDTPNGEQVDNYGCSINNKTGILYGYEYNEKSLYRVDKNDGSLTKVIELEHSVDWNLVYDSFTNQIISSSEQNSGGDQVSLIIIDLNSNSVTYPEFQYNSNGQRITDLVLGKDGILYGYEDDEKSLYRVDKNDGSLTKVIELEHNVDWNLVYDSFANQIIGSSEQNSNGDLVSLIIIDLNSNSVTYPEFKYNSNGQRITDLVIGYE